jgi:hypothetical protein
MKSIIYSAGPSMRRWIARGGHMAHADEYLRIGLNGAFRLLPDRWCHWCASGDARAYSPEYTANRSTVGLCCLTDEYLPRIKDFGWTGLLRLTWGHLPALRRVDSPAYSITAAIALADHLGSRNIHVYGCDMAIGQPNAAEPTTYDEARLAKEKRELSEVRAAICGTVTMHNTQEMNP